jgi:hypothetical protein
VRKPGCEVVLPLEESEASFYGCSRVGFRFSEARVWLLYTLVPVGDQADDLNLRLAKVRPQPQRLLTLTAPIHRAL